MAFDSNNISRRAEALLTQILKYLSMPGNPMGKLARFSIAEIMKPEKCEDPQLREMLMELRVELEDGVNLHKAVIEWPKLKRKREAEALALTKKIRIEQERALQAKTAAARARVEEERARAKEEQRRRLYEANIVISAELEEDYLGLDHDKAQELVPGISTQDHSSIRAGYVDNWFARFPKPSESWNPPDADQTVAISSCHDQTLVTARAGSGKTSTLVNRCCFLVKHCRVDPSQLLLLAFNKKAADELTDRLDRQFGIQTHVMTFHALAHAIVKPGEDMIYDDGDGREMQSDEIQRTIDDMLQDRVWSERVRQFMINHFKHDWNKLVSHGLNLSQEEGLAFRRALTHVSLSGDYVKSRGEQVIANFLFEHGITFKYEYSHRWGDAFYRPDFTLFDHKLVIEYFGMQGDSDYDDQSLEKAKYWSSQSEWMFRNYTPELLRSSEEQFLALLKRDLEAAGVRCEKLDEEEIWKGVQDRCLTDFAKMAKGFVSRCRKLGVNRDNLDPLLDSFRGSLQQTDFIGIARQVLDNYIQRLAHQGIEDFDGLMERAVKAIRSGATRFERKNGCVDLKGIRFVMIDEFQDFSPQFDALLNAISVHANFQLYCVGDDWQAINSFAGSDLSYYRNFVTSNQPAAHCTIPTNYRSSPEVVDFGNSVMSGSGSPARARQGAPRGKVQFAYLDDFELSDSEQRDWKSNGIAAAVRRLMSRPIQERKSIRILSRTNSVPGMRSMKLDAFHRDITCDLHESQKRLIHAHSAHQSKGLESDIVIVLDGTERRYPLVHPNWIYTEVLGDTPEKIIEDERRLFYVACTRASTELFIITERSKESPFIPYSRSRVFNTIDWQHYPEMPIGGAKRDWVVHVTNANANYKEPTISRKDYLKADRFCFVYRGAKPYWHRTYNSTLTLEHVIQKIRHSSWLDGCDGLEIVIHDPNGQVVRQLYPASGQI